MPASQGYTDNVVDLKVLQGLVGTDWLTESVLYKSGAVVRDTRPLPTGTFVTDVRTKMFEDEDEGQAIGIGSTLSSEERVQTAMNHPIVRRGNVALVDDIQGEIQAGGPEDMARMADEIRRAAAVYFDTALIKTLEGSLASTALSSLQVGAGAQLTLPLLNAAKFARGDKGYAAFQNGFILWNSAMQQYATDLGLVAATSNTYGMNAQNQIVMSGMVDKVLGMNVLVTDKLAAPDANDYYAYLLESGAFVVRGSMEPKIVISDVENGFATKLKFRITFSAGIRGVSWSGSQQDVYTNAELATGSNWTLGAASYKHVPAVRMLTDNN